MATGVLFPLFTDCAEFKTAAAETLTQKPQNWGYVLESQIFKFPLYLSSHWLRYQIFSIPGTGDCSQRRQQHSGSRCRDLVFQLSVLKDVIAMLKTLESELN